MTLIPSLISDSTLQQRRNIVQINEQKSGRVYVDEENPNKRYPSITKILGDDPEKKAKILEWRRRVGKEEANKISTRASGKGTRAHHLLEQTIKDGEIKFNLENEMPHVQGAFKSLLRGISLVSSGVYDLERRLISHELRTGGTVDCIARMKNQENAIIDFKTSNKLKKREWIDSYFKQCVAYSEMLREETGVQIENLIVLIAVDGFENPQIFLEKRKNWIIPLKTTIFDFYRRNS
jgi:genome maintenance exonuclease 1